MLYSLKSESFFFEGGLTECIEVLRQMNVMLAIHVEETGINFSMLRLNKNGQLIVEDDKNREIIVTRIN